MSIKKNFFFFTNQSIKLGESAYSCKWFHLSPQNARNFIIIILRCRKPMELTAAKFYVMNMEKFSSVSMFI